MSRRFWIVMLFASVCIALAGCGSDDPVPAERFVAALNPDNLVGSSQSVFVIPLNGDEAGVTTVASGTATLLIDKSWVDYRIELMDIGTSVTGVTLQSGAPGRTGSDIATLFDGVAVGPIDGVLTEGTLDADSITLPTISDLFAAIRTGEAYVIVNTTAHPNGELRGQTAPSGEARFVLEGGTMIFAVDAFILSGVTLAGIYSGVEQTSGPLRVRLFDGEPTGEINGSLVSGRFGPNETDGISFDSLLIQMRDGGAHVLVSTSASPTGAIRGQIQLQR